MRLRELPGFPHEVDLGEEREGKQDSAQISQQLREGKVDEMRKPEKRHEGRSDGRKISSERCYGKFEMPHEKVNWRCPVGCKGLKAQGRERSESGTKFESHQHTDEM